MKGFSSINTHSYFEQPIFGTRDHCATTDKLG